MFLCDINDAFFSTPIDDKNKRKPGFMRKTFNTVVGTTPVGTLARVGAVGAGIYGARKGLKNLGFLKENPLSPEFIQRQYRNKVRREQLQSGLKKAGDIGVKTATIGGGVATMGLAANQVKKEYDRRNRKWYEIL